MGLDLRAARPTDSQKGYRTRHVHLSGELHQKEGLLGLAARVPPAPSASAPAWPRNFPPSKGREGRQFPCGDWRHGSAARVHSSAEKFAKPREETPMEVGFCSGSRGLLNDEGTLTVR